MLDRVGGRSGKRDGGAGRAGIATVTVIGAVVAMVAALQVATWLGAGRLMAEVHGASEMKVFLAAGATGGQQKALEGKIASVPGLAAVTPSKKVLDVRMSDPSAAGGVKKAAAGDPAVNARIPTSDTTQPSQQLSAELALFRLFWPRGANREQQAWVTYSDPNSPKLVGDGADVVRMLAQAIGWPYTLEPTPRALASWERPLMSQWGHVAYVASVDRDGSGNLAGYTVWEMNFEGPFITNARHIVWAGPNALVVFMSPPNPVGPAAAEAAKFGPR